ncbi:flagellar hook protein FliD [Alicyclobacillaceae bacterium I2511]|nr:flagellar hook protein FliD [Alicyclobacillaceae bacterium I2511]
MSVNLLQQLNTISNPGGVGLPVTTYATEMQQALTAQLTQAPQSQLSTLSAQQSALTALQTAMNQFQQATDTLASSQNWNSVTAASSNPSDFSATTTSGAQPSLYTIAVNALAQNQTNILQTQSPPTTVTGASNLQAGTLTLTPNTLDSGQTTTIQVTAGESLASIVSAVNADTTTTGVQAQALYNGSGYLLAFSSTQTGTAFGYTLGGSLITTTPNSSQFTDTQSSAQDASITLDNVNFTSSSNTFANAIPNVTLNVFQQTASTGTLSITNDPSSAVQSVQTWMSAYNSLSDLLHNDTAFSSSTGSTGGTTTSAGPLFTDFNANSLLAQLPSALNQVVPVSGSTLNSLASIGIVEDPTNGHLEFQSASGYSMGNSTFTGSLQDGQTMFTNALATSATSVQQLFGVVQNNEASSAIPTSGILGSVNNTLNNFLLGQGNQVSAMQGDLNSISAQQLNVNNYLTQINQQITQTVANFTSQLNQLNAAMQQSQAQMQQLNALFGNSSSSSTSSTSSSLP